MATQNPFEARGLDPEIAAKLGAYCREKGFYFDYRSQHRLQYTKFRSWDKETMRVHPSGIPKQLWLLHTIEDLPCRPQEPLVMTEGEFDSIAAIMGWGGYAVSVPNGAISSRTEPGKLIADDMAFSFLWGKDLRLIPELEQFDRIILAMDGDIPGQIMRDELAMRIGPGRCWAITYPEGCKDLNDVLMRHGAEAVRAILLAAKPIRPGRLVTPSDIPSPRYTQMYSSGWSFMDKHVLLTRPELVVVTGIPGSGKGIFTRAICYHLAEQYGLRTAFWTPEDPPHRLRRDMKRFGMRKFSHPTAEQQKESDKWYNSHFMISQLGDKEAPTIQRLIDEMESAVFHYNCQGFVMDPWNCICHDLGRLNETQYVERILEELKAECRRLALMLFICAHPTKIKSGDEVDLYKISGSSNWYNKADHGMIVHRMKNSKKEYTEISQMTIEKSKDHETMGAPGRVYMKYDPSKADYAYHPDPDQ